MMLSSLCTKGLSILPKSGVINSIISDINNKIIDFNKYVFIFDDVERTSLKYDVLLGFFDRIADQSNLKAILVCNEDEIKEKDKEDFYKNFKEKVVGLTIEYSTDMQWEFDNIVECYVNDKQYKHCLYDYKYAILKLFKSADSCNLRTLIFICKRFTEIYKRTFEIYKKYDIESKYSEYFLYEFICAITGSSILIKEKNKNKDKDKDFKNNNNVISYVDKNESLNGAYMSYKFIDDYLTDYFYDEDAAIKIIIEFTGNKKIDKSDISNHISSIYKIDNDEQAKAELKEVLKEIEEDKININIYPQILDNIFILCKTLLSNEEIENLKNQIKNNAHERVGEFSSFSWSTFKYYDNDAKVLKTNYKESRYK